MRLHHLEITAFGPFAGTVEVDFDELSTAGLFLLTGATGAGKSSVLDAVCFALYGQVPGDRAGAKHLRSDHAGPQVAPRVVLRLSIGDRELQFSRSPSWSRPKLRGTGETKAQAHVVVEERSGDGWTMLTNRLDDAGLLVTDLLGMTCTQFTQVAMLPQGRFQAFLRASSSERHAVLQQLFRTDRFERVERWLVDERVRTRRAANSAGDAVLETVNRLREATGAVDEPTWLADLGGAALHGDLERWAGDLRTVAAEETARCEAASVTADLDVRAVRASLDIARRNADLRARGARASADLERIAERSTEHAAARRSLSEHERAAALASLATRSSATESAAALAEQRWTERRTALQGLTEDSRDALVELVEHSRAAHTLAAAFAPRAALRRDAMSRRAEIQVRLQAIESSVAELELVLAAQPRELADAVAAVHEARAAASRHPQVVAEVQRLEALLAASRRAEVVGLELVAARTDVLEATAAAQSAKETYLDLREARINQMASELAGRLASGCSCPVCGSASHPAPARSHGAAVGRTEEEHARRTTEDAEFELQARQVAIATLTGELAGLEARLDGVDRTLLPRHHDDAVDEAERLEPLVAALDVLVAREASCRARLADAGTARQQLLVEHAGLHAESEQTAAVVRSIDDEWRTLLEVPGAGPGEHLGSSPADLVGLRARRVGQLESALEDLDDHLRSRSRAAEARAELKDGALRAGFASSEQALAALLTEDRVRTLTTELEQADLLAHAARATLADREVAAALTVPPEDVAGLVAAETAASGVARAAVSAHDAATARERRLQELCADLDAGISTWAPLQQHHRQVSELAALVEGKSVDNPLRMRLAAYVLAERLRQVVAAANERLARMSDQRYALEHSDDRGFGEQRGGLSLRVRDGWNGVHRDPATLSGGETFVVSLALALGLADTVAHEAGGTDIDTLFIDEGFGSLDADTLEDVMDTLDSLRDGGRVVGLVSHVPELRSRITTQLEVTKGRTGSTIRTALASG